MTVNELIQMLSRHPSDLEVVHGMYSDFKIIEEEDFFIIDGVHKEEISDGFVMESGYKMSPTNEIRRQKYLALTGN